MVGITIGLMRAALTTPLVTIATFSPSMKYDDSNSSMRLVGLDVCEQGGELDVNILYPCCHTRRRTA